MKKINEDRAGVWIDHKQAYVVAHNEDGKYVISTIKAHGHGATANEKKRVATSEHSLHKREQQAAKDFLTEVTGHLGKYDHILLAGPSTFKSELHHFLMKRKSFKGKRIATTNADRMTQRQLLAFMKKHLGKPMDIFREEEVV